MAQSLGWFWGLAPLALLWGVGNAVLDDAIQQDVGRRAVAAAMSAADGAEGARPFVARVAGRDVAISGEVLSADGASKATAQLRAEFGVRRALGGLSQAVAQRPYSWSATRQGDLVTLNGFVPDEAAAMANVAAVSALPGLRVADRQTLAFGAPAGFRQMTGAVLAELPKLSVGKLALDDGRFCIEGQAASPDAFLALRRAVPALAQTGFQPVDCALEPPTVTPYRWAAARGEDGRVTVSGYYPSDELRAQMLGLLKASFPDAAAIEDKMAPALGAPAAFLARVTRAIGDLARLRTGKAELEGEVYALAGQGPETFEACQALRLLVAQLDGPDSVAQATIACPPAPPPSPPPALPTGVPLATQLPAVEPPVLAMPALPDIPPLSVPVETPAPVSPAPAPDAVVTIDPPSLPDPPAPPAPPVTLRWSAQKGPQGLVVTGLVGDDAARARMRAAAAELAQASIVADEAVATENLATEPDFDAATRFAFTLLGRMKTGSVALAGKDLTLSGETGDEAGWRSLMAALSQNPLPAGLSAGAGLAAVAVRPYGVSFAVDRSGVSLRGYLPDEASREVLRALVEASPLRGKLSDSTTTLPSAPPGFAGAARLALVNLLRLDLGSATIDETGVLIQGLTCRDLIKSEVETSASSERPGGLPVTAQIGLRQTGCVIDPPNTCQNDLDLLTKRNTVLFGQGTSVVALDATTERVISEAHAILGQCPAARITIEGHANSDGEGRFNNLDLSQRRALRVRDELVRRGIAPEQLAVAGFGAQRPLVPHGAPDARVMNRRVQFTVAK